MKLRVGVLGLNIVFGVKDSNQLNQVLNDPVFQQNLRELFSLHGMTVMGEVSGNGVMSEGTVEVEEPRIITLN